MSRTSVEPVSDVLLLAAVERAQRHRVRGPEGALWQEVVRHLGLVHGPWTTRRLGPQRDALLADGVLSCRRRHGVLLWALTDTGERRLRRARGAGEVGVLPESPQHREWHDAREAASDRIDELRARVGSVLVQAGGLLTAEGVSSDAWFELGEHLQRACWTLGSATYCLREWPEPDDAHADVDDGCDPGDEELDPDERVRCRRCREGRRNVRRWSDPD